MYFLKVIYTVIILAFMQTFCKKIDPTGVYVYRENNYDTIYVKSNGAFIQHTYNNGKFVYGKETSWERVNFKQISVNAFLLYSDIKELNADTCIDEDMGYGGLFLTDRTISWRFCIDMPETEYFYDKISSECE